VDWYDAAIEYRRRARYRLAALPADWKRELVALMLVNREVNNGAYLQFLGNHGREMYVWARRALSAIGAKHMADIIDCCQALVDAHLTAEGQSYEELDDLLPEPAYERVLELSYEFMGYPDDVGDLAESHYRDLIESDERRAGKAKRRR
jgi:Domain of unknown function (DUF4375)